MAININAKTTGVGGLETSADNSGNINIQSGGSTVMSVTSSGVAVTGSFSQNGAVYSTQPSFRNLIINGDMRIDQRNAGASVTQIDGGSFITDRFYNFGTVTSKFTSQQVSDAPDGFNYSLKNTSSSSYTVGSAEQFWVTQKIEGYNIAHLGWGTANAKTVTLSFWVKSSLTGTFGGSLTDINRSYVFSYTISSANTWEKKTITISGDTSGTWNATNGVGVGVYFSLGSGSTYQNTSGSWYSGNYKTATGATSVVGTSGATFYITGVQLEVGSTATEFEHLPYDVELARCQRYYEVMASGYLMLAVARTSDYIRRVGYQYKVTKRASPTITITSQTPDGASTIGTYLPTTDNVDFNTSGGASAIPRVNAFTMDSEL